MSTTYGKAEHFLKNSASAAVLTPQQADGSAMTIATTYVSPLVQDISVTVGGNIVEFTGATGQIDAFDVAGEYVDITVTVLPQGSSNANALLSSHVFRKGTPFAGSNFPVLKLYGHTAEGSPVISDLLNGTMFLQSDDRRLSLEGATTGTMTFRRYIASISDTMIT